MKKISLYVFLLFVSVNSLKAVNLSDLPDDVLMSFPLEDLLKIRELDSSSKSVVKGFFEDSLFRQRNEAFWDRESETSDYLPYSQLNIFFKHLNNFHDPLLILPRGIPNIFSLENWGNSSLIDARRLDFLNARIADLSQIEQRLISLQKEPVDVYEEVFHRVLSIQKKNMELGFQVAQFYKAMEKLGNKQSIFLKTQAYLGSSVTVVGAGTSRSSCHYYGEENVSRNNGPWHTFMKAAGRQPLVWLQSHIEVQIPHQEAESFIQGSLSGGCSITQKGDDFFVSMRWNSHEDFLASLEPEVQSVLENFWFVRAEKNQNLRVLYDVAKSYLSQVFRVSHEVFVQSKRFADVKEQYLNLLRIHFTEQEAADLLVNDEI